MWNGEGGSGCGSPCHAGHAAGCHHGTFSSLCCCCSIQLCGLSAPFCITGSAAQLGPWLGFTGVLFGMERGEARGGGRGHFGSSSSRETELQGHGERRQGRIQVVSGVFFHLNSDETLFYTVLRNKHGIFRAALSPPPAPQNFRSFNLVNWPPRQTDSQTATPPSPSPFHPLSSRPLSPPSQPLCSLPLIHFFASSRVTSIHPSPCHQRESLLCLCSEQASSCSGFIVCSDLSSCSKLASRSGD